LAKEQVERHLRLSQNEAKSQKDPSAEGLGTPL